MTWLNDRQRNDLDNYITGHYGEDQTKDERRDDDDEPEIDEDKFRHRLDGAIDEIMSLPTLRHADDCECEDCHDRDPLNGPRSITSALVWLAVLCCGLAVLIVWYRLFQ